MSMVVIIIPKYGQNQVKAFYVNCIYICRGNLLMIGPIGVHLGTLCKLALHVADIAIHPVDTSKQNTFLDGVRSAVRLTGAEGKILTLFFTVSTSFYS